MKLISAVSLWYMLIILMNGIASQYSKCGNTVAITLTIKSKGQANL